MKEKKYLVAMHKYFGVQLNKYYTGLLSHYGSFEEMWKTNAYPDKTLGISYDLWNGFVDMRKKLDPEKYLSGIIEKGIRIISRDDEDFPNLLLHIYNIPCILYYCGDVSFSKKDALAIVGTRKPTYYGLKQARIFSGKLSGCGLVIASGLARGIDVAAHEAALDNGGKTIAVLGSGLDVLYPRENRKAFDRITEYGLALSEFPPGTPPLKRNFPIRNRIISGLSLGVLVIEAQARSGSLITVDCALEQGREVYALPGCVSSPQSIGPLRLIQNGAKPVICPEDIMEEEVFQYNKGLFAEGGKYKEKEKVPLDSTEKSAILNTLSWEPVHVDYLMNKVENKEDLFHELLILELKGLIKQLPGKYYVRA